MKPLSEQIDSFGLPLEEASPQTMRMEQQPTFFFDREGRNEWMISGSFSQLFSDRKYLSGEAAYSLPGILDLYVNEYGKPERMYLVASHYTPSRVTTHAVFVEQGKDMIRLWSGGRQRTDALTKEFERQAKKAGYTVYEWSRGKLRASQGYWLSESVDQWGVPLQEDEKTGWSFLDEVMAQLKPGSIVQVKAKDGSVGFITVLPDLMHGKNLGFHYYPSDKAGNLQTDRKRGIVNHSNAFSRSDEMEIVGHRPVKEHQFKEFTWYETGIDPVDRELSNLDERMQLFKKYASARLKEVYADQEARNFHQENAEMVREFAEHVAAGGAPAAFSVES